MESGLTSWLIYDKNQEGRSIMFMYEELTSMEIMFDLSSSEIMLSGALREVWNR